ncbi:MAG: hypothetical protein CVU79_08210 [Elusimicrobia bacterium HGW-Elusimicrobia-3]|nr:MAG: hypothetical protein CVU79_08210 [Elusimicrobia bacterium HGW-Elusimicrobia-3]
MLLPAEMKSFKSCAEYLVSQSAAPDEWKGFLDGEQYRHYVDIDFFGPPPFGSIRKSLNDVIEKYGEGEAVSNGVVPWTIAEHCEMLTLFLKSSETFNYAMLCAAVMGHYVADAHQPLHTTENYDGQYTGNQGIHFRYESRTADVFFDGAVPRADNVRYVADPLNFAFDFIIDSHDKISVILAADTGHGNNLRALWADTADMTRRQVEKAAEDLASLWYSAWKNAGSPKMEIKLKTPVGVYSEKDYQKMLALRDKLKISGK